MSGTNQFLFKTETFLEDGRTTQTTKESPLDLKSGPIRQWISCKWPGALGINVQLKIMVSMSFYQHYPVIMSSDSKGDSPEKLWATSCWVQEGTSLFPRLVPIGLEFHNRRNSWLCVLSEVLCLRYMVTHRIRDDFSWILSSYIYTLDSQMLRGDCDPGVMAAVGHLGPSLLENSLWAVLMWDGHIRSLWRTELLWGFSSG